MVKKWLIKELFKKLEIYTCFQKGNLRRGNEIFVKTCCKHNKLSFKNAVPKKQEF